MAEPRIKQVEEKVLNVAIEVVKKGEGALFVIGGDVTYDRLLKQKFEPFSVFDPGAEKILLGLAVIDGAVIIGRDGAVRDYSALIKDTKPLTGFGTRHAAALTAAKEDNIVVLCSEEERKIKIFRKGKMVMQVDALQKNIEKEVPEISNMLESPEVKSLLESVGAGFIGTIGVATLAPALGISLLPGVIIFGGSYFAIKKLLEKQ